jgi:hypothetical protein
MSTVSIEVVQAQANALGIPYHHRAGAEKIAGLVAAHLAAHPEDAKKLMPDVDDNHSPDEGIDYEQALEASEKVEPEAPSRKNGDEPPVKPMTAVEYRRIAEKDRVKNIAALRRVRITCMNPAKREWPGEIISVGSGKHGTFKKYIPFNGEPYHIPQIIYDVLKERQCTLYRTEKMKDGRGGSHRVGYQAPEFAIADLPPLTKKELEELRDKQQMAKAGL